MMNFIQRLKNKLPEYKYQVWYNHSAHTRQVVYPIIFDKDGKYIDCKVGLKCIMGKTDKGQDIYYEVTDINYRSGDWLYDTDGIKCDMKFSHVETNAGSV